MGKSGVQQSKTRENIFMYKTAAFLYAMYDMNLAKNVEHFNVIRFFFFCCCKRLFILRHKKWRGIMLYPQNRLSIRPSVGASFPGSNFSIFWTDFGFKICIGIDIGEEWFGIANGLISLWPLIYVKKNVFFPNIFRING